METSKDSMKPMPSCFQTPDEAKLDYNRIQRGGDIPHYGLRMSAPDRAKGRKQTICTFI